MGDGVFKKTFKIWKNDDEATIKVHKIYCIINKGLCEKTKYKF